MKKYNGIQYIIHGHKRISVAGYNGISTFSYFSFIETLICSKLNWGSKPSNINVKFVID